MNDQVLTEQPGEAEPKAPLTPEQRMEGLEAAMGRMAAAQAELTKVVGQAAQVLTAPPQVQQALQQPPPQESVEKFLERLATDPQGAIGEVAQRVVGQAVSAQVQPTQRTMVEAVNKQLIQGHKAEIDLRFGLGTFDEVFKPQLDKDMQQLMAANPAAAADPSTVEVLVNRLYGGANFGVLREKEKAMEVARSRGVSHMVPGGGVPRLRTLTGDELPNDVEQFLRDVEKSTGEVIDRKGYAKLYYTGTESGPGRHRTTMAEYLQAIGADADTKRMYLGERQT